MLCERKIARKIANRVNDIIDGVYDNRQDKSMKYRYINILLFLTSETRYSLHYSGENLC
jgi:hypothetical protein